MVEKCSLEITQDLSVLCQHIGELSAATETNVSVMEVSHNHTQCASDSSDDENQVQS